MERLLESCDNGLVLLNLSAQSLDEVVSAMDAVGALSVAKAEDPNLVILDLGLPTADGYSVMERLKEVPDLSVVPIVVLTAKELTPGKQQFVFAKGI